MEIINNSTFSFFSNFRPHNSNLSSSGDPPSLLEAWQGSRQSRGIIRNEDKQQTEIQKSNKEFIMWLEEKVKIEAMEANTVDIEAVWFHPCQIFLPEAVLL